MEKFPYGRSMLQWKNCQKLVFLTIFSQWLSSSFISDALVHIMLCHVCQADVLPNPWLKSWNIGLMSLCPNSSAWFTSACLTVLYPARTTTFLGPKCTVNTDPYFLDNCETNIHNILLMYWSVWSSNWNENRQRTWKVELQIADRKFLSIKVIDMTHIYCCKCFTTVLLLTLNAIVNFQHIVFVLCYVGICKNNPVRIHKNSNWNSGFFLNY